MKEPAVDELKARLTSFRRRLRLVDGWDLIQAGMWLALAGSLAIQLLGRLLPIEGLWAWTASLPLVFFGLTALYHLLKPMSLLEVARRVDFELGLFERLSTRLALVQQPAPFPQPLVEAQAADALASARQVHISTAYPFRLDRRSWLKAFVVAGFTIGLILWPNPMTALIEQRKAIAQEAQVQAQKVEELRAEIEQAEELSLAERQEIERLLAELAQELQANPGNLEQALADYSKAERELRTFLDPGAPVQAANLNSLVQQLNSLAGQPSTTDQNLANQAQQALEQLAEQQQAMDASQKSKLSATLAQMAAQASQSGDRQLAGALSALSQAALSGEAQQVKQASQQAGRAIAQAQRRLQAQSRLDQALSSLQSGQQALAQAGASLAQGSQLASSQGQVSGGGGTNAPILPPGTSQGQAGRPQGNKPLGGEDDLIGTASSGREMGNFLGDQLFIPGLDSGQGSTLVQSAENTAPGLPNPALVPYQQAYYSYLNAAMQSISQDYIPQNLAKYVQQYFLSLEPK